MGGFSALAVVACGFAAVASTYVMLIVRFAPRLLLRSYPPEIRAAVPPQTAEERLQSVVIGAPFLLLLVVGPIAAALWLASLYPVLRSALNAGSAAAAILTVVNTVDFLVLDILWLGWGKPRWAAPPGAENVRFRVNYGDHLRGFVAGSILAGFVGLAAGAAEALVWRA